MLIYIKYIYLRYIIYNIYVNRKQNKTSKIQPLNKGLLALFLSFALSKIPSFHLAILYSRCCLI